MDARARSQSEATFERAIAGDLEAATRIVNVLGLEYVVAQLPEDLREKFRWAWDQLHGRIQ